ncbi:MAG: class I adenylate-forming enzyme family protein, partial [Proteobacteria bacterium]|nr:class I adenylate-forming enzyme family protein [Pseudomonadota bacterium]
MNIAQFLDMTASRYPYKTAVICNGRKITYRDLKYRIDHLAAALQHKGIKKGTAVAILSFNSIEFVEIIFALMKIGAIGVPLNHRLTKNDIRTLLKHCEAKALFCEAALQELIPSDREGILHIFMIGADRPSAAVPYEELFSDMLYSHACPPVADNDPSCIIYTAGTTGKPRGVLLTHGNHIWNILNYSAALAMSSRDIELAATPLFHSSTLGRVFTYVFSGATFILCRKLNPHECLDIIQQE